MFINGLKYACSTCIKGHRSSHCSHVDRPLFEIRKKGRPVTQCTFCRDLRKTKQVHIKCACSSDKKVSSPSESQPLIIRNNKTGCSDDVCQDNSKIHHNQQCTCPNLSSQKQQAQKPSPTKQSPITATATATSKNKTTATTADNQSYFPQLKVTQDTLHQIKVTQDANLSLLAPLCNTTPPPPLVKEENLSYSWALITSPSSNQVDLPTSSSSAAAAATTAVAPPNHFFSDMLVDNNEDNLQHLGFIFHKPTSTQRFLDGQPRIRRRRSTNQKRSVAANSTTVTPTNYTNNNRLPVNALMDSSALTIDTIQQNYNLSTPPSSASSTTAAASSSTAEPMDMQFDYLTEQLEILSSASHQQSYVGDLANADELAAILNNVLQQEDDDRRSLPSSYAGSIMDPMSASPTTTTPQQKKCSTPTIINRSHCGSFVPRSSCCKPTGTVGGESVVITITPLTNTTNNNNSVTTTMMLEDDQTQQKTTTRIVTCYCGNQCTCPGCLVHPGNFFMGSDPYAGLMMNPSSSASSSCYGSDEEDMTSIYSKSNNFMSF